MSRVVWTLQGYFDLARLKVKNNLERFSGNRGSESKDSEARDAPSIQTPLRLPLRVTTAAAAGNPRQPLSCIFNYKRYGAENGSVLLLP